jgi:hypothetical protein
MMAAARNYSPSFRQGLANCAAESESPELWRGLVGAWLPLLGPTGNWLVDGSGRRTHGACLGTGSLWQSSAYGPLLLMNGTDNAVDCGLFSAVDTGPFTVLIGGASSVSGLGAWISNNTGNNQTGPFLLQRLGKNSIVAYSGNQSTSVVSIPFGVPHDIVLIRYAGSAGIELFVDNASTAAASGNSGIQTGQKLYLGYRDGLTQYWSGVLRYAYVYNRVLPPQLRQALAADPLAPFRLRRPVVGPCGQRSSAAYRRVLASVYGVSP